MDDEKTFVCGFKNCGKQYSTKYSLQRHFFIKHKKSKRFTCRVCKKILSSNQNLKEHSYTHSDEKPLVCSYPGCSKLFRQSSQLSAHKKIHLLSASGKFCQNPEFEKMEDWKSNWMMPFMECEGQVVMSWSGEVLGIPKIFEPDALRLRLEKLDSLI
jgi:uncharacterized Zn-finger protein